MERVMPRHRRSRHARRQACPRPLAVAVAVFATLLGSPRTADALDAAKALTQYRHRSFTADAGLPSSLSPIPPPGPAGW